MASSEGDSDVTDTQRVAPKPEFENLNGQSYANSVEDDILSALAIETAKHANNVSANNVTTTDVSSSNNNNSSSMNDSNAKSMTVNDNSSNGTNGVHINGLDAGENICAQLRVTGQTSIYLVDERCRI